MVQEMEFATERGRIGGRTGFNFGTGQLYTQNRFDDNRRRQLLGEGMESEMMMMAPEPEMEFATERGRIGGRTGFNFGTGQLYTQNRFDDRRRRHLLGEGMESEMMMMAPAPEIGEMDSTTRARIAFAPGRSFDVASSPEFL